MIGIRTSAIASSTPGIASSTSTTRISTLPTERIDWIEATGKHALMHARENTCLMREGLTILTERVDPAEFIRIHRSCTVRIDRIRQVHRWFRGN
jgi:two-component system, LytTR family, response regulator